MSRWSEQGQPQNFFRVTDSGLPYIQGNYGNKAGLFAPRIRKFTQKGRSKCRRFSVSMHERLFRNTASAPANSARLTLPKYLIIWEGEASGLIGPRWAIEAPKL